MSAETRGDAMRRESDESLGHLLAVRDRSSRVGCADCDGSQAGPGQIAGSQTFTDVETKILRKLAQVLREGIDDKHFPETDGKPSFRGERQWSQEKVSVFKPENPIALKELCRRHNPLMQHVQSLLSALGGSYRTAKTLEEMQNALGTLSQSCWLVDKDKYELLPNGCIKTLRSLCGTVGDVIGAFEEFGVFNAEFFGILSAVIESSKDIMIRMDGEYGSDFDYPATIDEYLDHILRPLVNNLKRYIEVLTIVSEKAIRQSQDIASQQHVNLTTIATFLSSVTATTLQISASAPPSVLTTVTNTFWFVSLVFSAASAVYSLLEMTWRRSAIRRPDQSLPALAQTWLRNGPVLALIVALMTFSVGLCLLAFLVTDQQGGVAPAAAPTGFAGAHAQAIFFLSVWYPFESWRVKHAKEWRRAQDSWVYRFAAQLFTKTRSVRDGVTNVWDPKKHYGARLKNRLSVLRGAFIGLLQLSNGSRTADADKLEELELGVQPSLDTKAASDFVAEGPEGLAEGDIPGLAIGGSMRTALSSESPGRPEDFLQFSTDCALLASALYVLMRFSTPTAKSDHERSESTVTVYRVDESFKVFRTFVVPDASPVRQISWHPDAGVGWDDMLKEGYLLVKSSRHIYIVNLDQPDRPLVHRLEGLDFAPAPVRWIREEESGIHGLSCLMGESLRVFAPPSFDDSSNDLRADGENTCTELESYDFSGLIDSRLVLDAAFYGEEEIVCLTKRGSEELDILVVDKNTMSIKKTLLGDPFTHGSATLSISQKSYESGKAFVHREDITEIFELEAQSGAVLMRTKAAGSFGRDNCMVYSVKRGQVLVYHGLSFSLLHQIKTPSPRAVVRDFASFALGHNPAFAFPYLFAFGGVDGSVKIWSIQSNRDLDGCESAELFEVHDRLDSDSDPVVRTGRFLTLSPVMPEPPQSGSRHTDDSANAPP